ncbi:MAG: prepilin-type N-terminal cleavage/methylation domain-containing protein [Deltaproteobacteria bacterium]|nr:prepilin-type N-terminal cleavage/methylation domain-containing protein [Deltaproteobacteria bacterium]
MSRPGTQQGFSLLEVMVSLAILSISLVAILNLHSGAVRMHNHAKFVSMATLLARSKMVDVEERIYAEDLSDFDETLHGDFKEEGYERFEWKAVVVKPELEFDATMIEGLFSQALGISPDEGSGGGAEGGLLSSLGGGIQGMITGQIQTLQTTIEESVREVRLTVSWTDITGPSDLTVVTHVIKVGDRGAPGGANDLQQSRATKALEDARKRLSNLPNMPGVNPNRMIPRIPPIQGASGGPVRKVGGP